MGVSEGSKREHVIPSGTVIKTLPPKVGAPTVILMSALAAAAAEPAITAAAVATRMVRLTMYNTSSDLGLAENRTVL
jgi:hypothetical protein